MAIYNLLGVTRPFDPLNRYTTSWLLRPILLAALRLLLSLYAFITIFVVFGWNGSHSFSQSSRRSFSYFTDLTYWAIAFYFLFSGLHTLTYATTGNSWLTKWPQPLQAAHAVFYTTIVTYPFLVTIVYWVILYKSPWFPVVFNAWSNISKHALNTAMALFEILIPATDIPPPLHLAILILILALYLALAYVTKATQGFYTYDFLNPAGGKGGKVAGYVFGILLAIAIIYGLVCALIWARKWLSERVLHKSAITSSKTMGIRNSDIEMSEESK